MPTITTRRVASALIASLALIVAAAGCSSDDNSSDTTTTAPDRSEPTGDVVEVPQVDPSDAVDYVEGTDVAIGQTADAGGLLITVASISPGTEAPEPESGAGTTIDVAATVENTADIDLAGPDVYVVCTDDGRFSTASESSEIGYLEAVAPGETLSGTYVVGVPDACGGPLLQARVLATASGGDHIAQWVIPPDALS